MLSLVHVSLLILGASPERLSAVESTASSSNEICVTDVPTQAPSLLQEILPLRNAQRNLSVTLDQQETTTSTSQNTSTEPTGLGEFSTKASSFFPQNQFRLTHAVLLAVQNNTWSIQSRYLCMGIISVTFIFGAGYLIYHLVVLAKRKRDSSDDEKAMSSKESSFTSGISEGFFKRALSSTSVATATPEPKRHTLMMEKDLVNIVANAHYDVTRFPGHVACITSDSSGDRHGFLEREIHARTHSKVRWVFGYLLAVAVTCLMPLIAVFGKTPTECAVIRTVSKIARPGTDAFHSLSEDEIWLCNIHKGHMQPVFIAVATSAGYVGPLICFVFAISLHISILAGAHRHWAFGFYTRTLLWLFNLFSPFIRKVLFNYVHKPENSSLSSIVFAWKWMSYTPYMIMYWWLTTMILFVIGAILMRELEWGGILILFVGRLYLPVMSYILGASDRLRHVITSALQNTYFPFDDDENTPSCSRPMSLSSSGLGIVKTDVWYRLFQTRGKCFACSAHEFDLLLRYIEDSHNGTKQGGKRWPIWWHDDVTVTGNNVLTEVFLEDMEVVITNSERASYSLGRKKRLASQGHSVEDGNLDAGAEEILMNFYKRIQALRWSAPDGK